MADLQRSRLLPCQTPAAAAPVEAPAVPAPDPAAAPDPADAATVPEGAPAAGVPKQVGLLAKSPKALEKIRNQGGFDEKLGKALAPPAPAADVAYGLLIERSAPGTDFAYDVVVGAVDAEGQLLDLPPLLASFSAGVNALSVPSLAPDYGKASGFVVLDMNPVGTRGCEGRQCVFDLPPMRQAQ